MKTSKKSTTTYLVTFATIVALPFAVLHAGGDSDTYSQNNAANPTEPSTNAGNYAEDMSSVPATEVDNDRVNTTDTGQAADTATTNEAARSDTPAAEAVASDTATHDQTATRDLAVIGPEVDSSSRSPNGVARLPNEARAAALDASIRARRGSVEVGEPKPMDLSSNHDVGVTYGEHGTRADLNHADAVEMQLNTEATTKNIEATEFENRDLAITLAESGVTEGKQIVLAIRTTGSTTTPEARQDLDQAIRKVEKAEQKLNGAITSGRSASESRWDTAREELAERYADYSEALENAREVAVDGGVRFQSHVTVDSSLPANRS